MERKPQLGAFDVGECIGEGGMAKVYRAVHRATGEKAAVKVIESKGQSKREFHREVQAQAGLAHPGVVELFDYGMIPEEAAQVWEETITAGSPYVVMELADRGSVNDHLPLECWGAVRRVLAETLDALAFAHARGVIHRDLKPANLLVTVTEEGPARIKVADFGLAHALEEERDLDAERLSRISGTPSYMAPEQFHGRWRSYGPWTDLYALGCIAWHLVCGKPPVSGKTAFVIAMRHCEGMLEAWNPRFAVPGGVESWVRRALAVDPEERFQRAADAAWMLPGSDGEMGDQSWWEMSVESPQTVRDSKWLATTVLLSADTETSTTDEVEPPQKEGKSKPGRPAPALNVESPPPVPTSWSVPGNLHLGRPPTGTGLGLFGLREVPFVGRVAERDRIWEALRAVKNNEELRIVLVVGESGVGKSRLVRWMATRAHEVGAVEVLYASHTPERRGPGVGMTGLVQRVFRTWKLSRGQVYEHLCEVLPPLDEDQEFRDVDARALTELIRPTDDEAKEVDGPRYHFRNARQEHALMARLLRRVSGRRTSLLWLDDLQYGSKALAFLEYLARAGESRPQGLVLATVRSDFLADDDELAARINALEKRRCCQRIDVEAIGAEEHRKLIDRMLPLKPELAETLARRTEGNPLFAHQLLSDWIASGKLESRPRGFAFVPGQTLSLPDDIHQLWMTRQQRVLKTYPATQRRTVELAMERAAVWGREVGTEEWHTICSDVGCRFQESVVNELVERGLAERSEGGWSFAHGLLVQSLKRKVREEGRWVEHHRRCAEMLEPSSQEQGHIAAQRRRRYAEHRIEAEDYEKALEPLLVASDAFFERGDPDQRKECLELHRQLLERLGLDELARPRLENVLRTSHVKFFAGDTEEAIADVEDVLERCQQVDEDELVWRARERLVRYLPRIGNWDEAEEQLDRALELATRAGDEYWQGKLHRCRGDSHFQRGELKKAQRSYRLARAHFRNANSQFNELLCEDNLGWVCMSRGEYEEAKTRFEKANRRAQERGFRLVAMHCLNGLADVARFSNELDEACKYYDKARRHAVEAGQEVGEVVCQMNLALVEMARGNFDRGEKLLDWGVARSEEMAIDRFGELIDCARILLACGRRQWPKARRGLKAYAGGWPEGRPVTKDHAWLLELAAEHAGDDGQAEVEKGLRKLARDLRERLE